MLDIENVTEALKTSPYGRCVYECGNDIVDHQVVNIEYDDGPTASMTMSACESSSLGHPHRGHLLILVPVTEAICDRGTRIQGSKGELIGDMNTFVSPSLHLHPFRQSILPVMERRWMENTADYYRRSSISSLGPKRSILHLTKEEATEAEMPALLALSFLPSQTMINRNWESRLKRS